MCVSTTVVISFDVVVWLVSKKFRVFNKLQDRKPVKKIRVEGLKSVLTTAESPSPV